MEFNRVIYDRYGSPQEVLSVGKALLMPPAGGEVTVRMIARPINPSDLIPIRGAYPHHIVLPAIPGYEGVGVVTDVGSGVSKRLIGRRVLPLRGEGTWQDYAKSPAAFAVSVPDTIDNYAAAQLYINPLTAWVTCTELLKLKPGDTLLVNAGGSAIGRIYAQLADVLGFRLIAVTRNPAYTEELLRLGAAAVIDTSRQPLPQAVMVLTGGAGAAAAIDSVGGSDGTALAYCLRQEGGGTLVTIGLLSGEQIDWARIGRETSATVKLFHLRHWNGQATAEAWQHAFDELMGLVEAGRLKLMPPRAEYGLEAVRDAVAAAESGGSNRGKVFISN